MIHNVLVQVIRKYWLAGTLINYILFLKDTISNRSTIKQEHHQQSKFTSRYPTSVTLCNNCELHNNSWCYVITSTTTTHWKLIPIRNWYIHHVKERPPVATTHSKKSSRKDLIDLLLARSLANVDESAPVPQVKKPSSNELFCSSLVEIFDRLSDRNNRMARVEIQQVLLKYEFVEAGN